MVLQNRVLRRKCISRSHTHLWGYIIKVHIKCREWGCRVTHSRSGQGWVCRTNCQILWKVVNVWPAEKRPATSSGIWSMQLVTFLPVFLCALQDHYRMVSLFALTICICVLHLLCCRWLQSVGGGGVREWEFVWRLECFFVVRRF
jgi:hypothetical protein